MNESGSVAPERAGDLSSSSPPQSLDDKLKRFVVKRASDLQSGLLRGKASGPAAELARLRRGAGRAPGEAVDAWGLVLDGLPDELTGHGDSPSPWEAAAYTALTTFAFHQQASPEGMHVGGPSLGAAVRRLASSEVSEEAVKRRFDVLVTASTKAEVGHHLRALVTQLRQHRIPLDYGRLAVDLRRLWSPSSATGVRLVWGRDFHQRAPRLHDDTAPIEQSFSPSLMTGDL